MDWLEPMARRPSASDNEEEDKDEDEEDEDEDGEGGALAGRGKARLGKAGASAPREQRVDAPARLRCKFTLSLHPLPNVYSVFTQTQYCFHASLYGVYIRPHNVSC